MSYKIADITRDHPYLVGEDVISQISKCVSLYHVTIRIRGKDWKKIIYYHPYSLRNGLNVNNILGSYRKEIEEKHNIKKKVFLDLKYKETNNDGDLYKLRYNYSEWDSLFLVIVVKTINKANVFPPLSLMVMLSASDFGDFLYNSGLLLILERRGYLNDFELFFNRTVDSILENYKTDSICRSNPSKFIRFITEAKVNTFVDSYGMAYHNIRPDVIKYTRTELNNLDEIDLDDY